MKQTMTDKHDPVTSTHAVGHSTPRMTAPRMTWVSVTDARGHQRLVARWSDPTVTQAPSAAHAA